MSLGSNQTALLVQHLWPWWVDHVESSLHLSNNPRYQKSACCLLVLHAAPQRLRWMNRTWMGPKEQQELLSTDLRNAWPMPGHIQNFQDSQDFEEWQCFNFVKSPRQVHVFDRLSHVFHHFETRFLCLDPTRVLRMIHSETGSLGQFLSYHCIGFISVHQFHSVAFGTGWTTLMVPGPCLLVDKR